MQRKRWGRGGRRRRSGESRAQSCRAVHASAAASTTATATNVPLWVEGDHIGGDRGLGLSARDSGPVAKGSAKAGDTTPRKTKAANNDFMAGAGGCSC